MKTGILLINLGTPDSPSVKDVRKYLSQFLNDPSVIDINPIARFFLVNFIIVPFRAKKSAQLYRKTWVYPSTEQPSVLHGSPLLINSRNLAENLQKKLNSDITVSEQFIVELGMRYQKPDMGSAFKKLKNAGVRKIIAIPLFPQYASSTTGSAILELKRIMKLENFKDVLIPDHFFSNDAFIHAWDEVAKKYVNEKYDFYLFSYHGLPLRHIFKECNRRGNGCSSIDSCEAFEGEKTFSYCYRSACYETTRLLVQKLNIPEGKFLTSFQSRLSNNWLMPFSDKVIEQKAKEGVKKMLVFSPSFVADCLETVHEIGSEYRKLFEKHGGKKLQLVESLNDSEGWVEALKTIIHQNLEVV